MKTEHYAVIVLGHYEHFITYTGRQEALFSAARRGRVEAGSWPSELVEACRRNLVERWSDIAAGNGIEVNGRGGKSGSGRLLKDEAKGANWDQEQQGRS